MSYLPQLKAREIIRALRALGFEFKRQKGSHAFYQHPITGRSTVVPIHAGEDIDRSLLQSILRETGITPEELLDIL